MPVKRKSVSPNQREITKDTTLEDENVGSNSDEKKDELDENVIIESNDDTLVTLAMTNKRRKKLSDFNDPLLWLLSLIFIYEKEPGTGINGTWARELLEIIREYTRDLIFPCYEFNVKFNDRFPSAEYVDNDTVIVHDRQDNGGNFVNWYNILTGRLIKQQKLEDEIDTIIFRLCSKGTDIFMHSDHWIHRFDIKGNHLDRVFEFDLLGRCTRFHSMVLSNDSTSLYICYSIHIYDLAKQETFIQHIDTMTRKCSTVIHESETEFRSHKLAICPTSNDLYDIRSTRCCDEIECPIVVYVDTVNKTTVIRAQLPENVHLGDTHIITESGYLIYKILYYGLGCRCQIEAKHLLTGETITLAEGIDQDVIAMRCINETRTLSIVFNGSFMSVPLPFQLFPRTTQ